MNKERKFKVGDIVELKESLEVGKRYLSECKSYGDAFTSSMRNNLGKEAKVISYRGGGYTLAFDGVSDSVHIYYDDMLQKPVVSEYTFNYEVEALVDHMIKGHYKNLIDKALDKGDKELFDELVNKYKTCI